MNGLYEDLEKDSLKIAADRLADLKKSHAPARWPDLVRQVEEEHRERMEALKLWIHQQETGLPF